MFFQTLTFPFLFFLLLAPQGVISQCPGRTINTQAELEMYYDSTCTSISGQLRIGTEFSSDPIIDLSPLKNVSSIQAGLNIRNTGLKNLNGLEKLKHIGGSLLIYDNAHLEEAELPTLQTVFLNLEVFDNDSLKFLKGGFPNTLNLGNIFIARNPLLEDISILDGLSSMKYDLTIRDNPLIKSLQPLANLHRCGALTLEQLHRVPGLEEMTQLTEATEVHLIDIPRLKSVEALRAIEAESFWAFTLENCDSLAQISPLLDWNFPIRTFTIRDNELLTDLKSFDSIPNVQYLIVEGNPSLKSIDFNHLENGLAVEIIDNDSLVEINGLRSLDSLWLYLYIEDNELLEDVGDLGELRIIGDEDLYLRYNPSLKSQDFFPALEYIDRDLWIWECGMDSLYGFEGLNMVKGNIVVEKNTQLKIIKGFHRVTSIRSIGVHENNKLEIVDLGPNLSTTLAISFTNNQKLRSISGFEKLNQATIRLRDCPVLDSVQYLSSFVRAGGLIALENTAMRSFKFLENLDTINSQFLIRSNPSLQSFEALTGVIFEPPLYDDWFEIINNDSVKNLTGLENFKGTLEQSMEISGNDQLNSLKGLENVKESARHFTICNNPSLQNLDALSSLTTIPDSFIIDHNAALNDISGLAGLEYVGDYLQITDNPQLNDCKVLCQLDEEATIEEGIILRGNDFSCSDMEVVRNFCKGIIIGVATENPVSLLFRAWPNPVGDVLSVEYLGKEYLSLELYDLQGRRLQIWNHDQQIQQLNLSAFAEGMYLLKVREKGGVLRQVVKVIKGR